MEYNKIQNRLQGCIDFYEKSDVDSIKWDEYKKLEKVYKNNRLSQELKERANYLHEWMNNIGKEVYLSNKSFNYTLVDKFSEMDFLNQNYFDTTKSIEFTEEVFDRLCFDYITYQVERLTEQLIEREITSNSSCKITNLVFEWNLECNQELIKIFKSILELN